LTFSFLLKPIKRIHQVTALPMAVAIAVAISLEQYGLTVQTKWPNDLLVRKRKICGILTECPQPLSIVVGVGVNINMTSDEADLIDQPATSVFIESGQQLSVQSFLDRLLPYTHHLDSELAKFRELPPPNGLKEAIVNQLTVSAAESNVSDLSYRLSERANWLKPALSLAATITVAVVLWQAMTINPDIDDSSQVTGTMISPIPMDSIHVDEPGLNAYVGFKTTGERLTLELRINSSTDTSVSIEVPSDSYKLVRPDESVEIEAENPFMVDSAGQMEMNAVLIPTDVAGSAPINETIRVKFTQDGVTYIEELRIPGIEQQEM